MRVSFKLEYEVLYEDRSVFRQCSFNDGEEDNKSPSKTTNPAIQAKAAAIAARRRSSRSPILRKRPSRVKAKMPRTIPTLASLCTNVMVHHVIQFLFS